MTTLARVRSVLAYDVFLFSSCIVAVMLSLALHEVAGHCFVAWLLGAHVHGVELGIGLGGVAHYDMPAESGALARAAATSAGIAVDLLTGAAALFAATRTRRVHLRMLFAVFAAAALLPTLGYVAYGLYYGVGDSGRVADLLGLAGLRSMRAGDTSAWIYVTLAIPIVAAVVMRIYLGGQHAVFPARRAGERVLVTGATVGVVFFAGALAHLATATEVPAGIQSMQQEASTARVDAAKSSRALAAARSIGTELRGRGRPEAEVTAAIQASVEKVLAEPVPPSEIHGELPLQALTMGLVVLGGLVGVLTFRRRVARVRARPRIRWRAAFAMSAMTVALGVLLATISGCGGAPPPAASNGPEGSPAPARSPTSSAPPRSSASEAPEPFLPIASATDVVAPWVRPERSSRLAVPRPLGRTRERWSFAFDPKLDPKLDPVFVVSAGTRIVVQGRPFGSPTTRQSAFVLLDTRGHRIAGDLLGGDLVRLEPAAGKFYGIGGTEMPTAFQLADGSRGPDKLGPDDPRGAQGSLAVRAATHGATHVFIQEAGVEIDDRAAGRQRTVAEPPVVPLDGAIDDDGNLHLLVRQGAASGQTSDLALWTTPLGVGSIGRIRIGPLRRDRAAVPPIVGKSIRVVVLDDRLLAIAPDGKTMWERKGALTGGATLTADDRLLVATDGKVLAIDQAGRATEVLSAPNEIFLTPPIITGTGLLLVASGNALHAYGFE